MKVLVTGGGGDVGIALSERLIELGHDVVVYDLRGDGVPDAARFVEGDVRDFERLGEAARGCEAGVHLAVLSGESPAEDILSVNLLGAYGFLCAARDARFRNAIVASSAPVHLAPSEGDNGILPPTLSGDVYDLTKALQEVAGRDFHAHGLPVLCLRFGHIVRGAEGLTLDSSLPLRDELYCRGGWVAIEDVADACAAALDITPRPATFEVLNIVGSRAARDRFRVAAAEERLGITLKYDFAGYESQSV